MPKVTLLSSYPTFHNTLPYYGQVKCSSNGCKNNAYYHVRQAVFCGVHSKKQRERRIQLAAMPKNVKDALDEESRQREEQAIKVAQQENQKYGRLGSVIVSQLKMMKAPDEHNGFLKVFPNNRHQNRSDGFGCCSLSPMQLGPVEHGQPNLPAAKNIENFHQGSKCFAQEVDSLTGEPSALYYLNRRSFYLDDIPHRHKFIGHEKKNKNIPLYFVWVDKQGIQHKLDYVTSRQFYCNFYERLAKKTQDFKKLEEMRRNGINLQIIGYDGRPMDKTTIEQEYLNESKPFGHELVLYTLLVEENPENYPWRKFKTFDF